MNDGFRRNLKQLRKSDRIRKELSISSRMIGNNNDTNGVIKVINLINKTNSGCRLRMFVTD